MEPCSTTTSLTVIVPTVFGLHLCGQRGTTWPKKALMCLPHTGLNRGARFCDGAVESNSLLQASNWWGQAAPSCWPSEPVMEPCSRTRNCPRGLNKVSLWWPLVGCFGVEQPTTCPQSQSWSHAPLKRACVIVPTVFRWPPWGQRGTT